MVYYSRQTERNEMKQGWGVLIEQATQWNQQCFDISNESWICVVLVRFWARIDGKPRPIGSSIQHDEAEMDVVFFNKVRCEASLTEMYFHNARVDKPLKVSTKKPFHRAHIINC